MKAKKLICGLAASAIAMSALAVTASASYSVDETTGAQTWDLTDVGTGENTVTITKGYYTYGSDGLSSNLGTSAQELSTDSLLIYTKDTDTTRNYFSSLGFYSLYRNNTTVQFKAKSNGTVALTLAVDSSKSNPAKIAKIIVNEVENSGSGLTHSVHCNAGDTIQVSATGNNLTIANITFTPDKEEPDEPTPAATVTAGTTYTDSDKGDAAYTWTAGITPGETVTAQSDLEWVVTATIDGSESTKKLDAVKPAAGEADTELYGNTEVTYGLIITGTTEQLNSITKVSLIEKQQPTETAE